MDVAEWLRALGLERYEATFRENDVGAELLPNLTADDLKELGITSVGHRRQLLEAITALRPEGTPGGDSVSLSSQPPIRPTGNLGASETTGERRPLSVMFCDLIGSTALSSRLDPEDLGVVIRTYQASVATTIQQFDGFIARYVGDGVLIYFGWPEARETDAERAVRAGLAVAAAVSETPVNNEALQVRIGIATGLVVIGEPIGSGDSRQQTAVGETPNLAARLQGLAGPNQVVIDAATRRQIGGLFECQDLGTVELKGLPAAVPAWLVLGAGMPESRFEALHGSTMTPLVGRDEEMGLLLRRWGQAKAGSGRVVLISAEAGVGKSRLAEALAERIAAEPHVRLRYFCSPHHQDTALFPVIAQMERAAGFQHADAPTVKLAKLQALLAATAPPMEEMALIADLHSLPSADLAPPLDVTPQRKKEKTFEALLRQVEGLSRQQPVLMLFDDIHWIDPSSRELLDCAVEQVTDWPVLLLIMFRPEFQPPWIGQPHVTTLTLNRLDRRDTAAMIANVAGKAALSPEIVEEIAQRTDGVPLFIEELTKAVLESGAEATAELSSAPHPASSVPATLHASLMARLDRLGQAAKDVAQTGAAIGREFRFELLSSVTDLPEPQLGEALDRLTNAGLLFARGMPPQTAYIFKHALVQDTAYGTLLRSRRQQLHGRIAATLEDRFPEIVLAQPALLAQHYTAAGLAEKAVAYWLKAGQQALARSAMAEAVAQSRKGLGVLAGLPDGPSRRQQELDLQTALGSALTATKGYSAADVEETLSRARALAEQLGRPEYLVPLMAMAEAIAHLDQGLELVSTLPHPSERDSSELGLRSLLGLAWQALKGLPAPEVWTSLHPALALAKSLERHDALLPVLWGLTFNVLTQGRVAESLLWVQEMLDVAKATADADLLIAGHSLACTCYCYAGEPTKVVAHADKVLKLYDDEKHHHLADILYHDPKTTAGTYASICTWMLGYPDRAARLANEKDAHARRRGHPFDLGYALTIGAHEFDHRYDHEDLRKRAEECERLGRENSMPVLLAYLAPIGRGLALIREGKPAEGIAPLKAGIAFREASGGKMRSPTWKAFLAEGMALTGDLDNGLQLIDEAIAQVERPGWEERLYYAEILRLKGWMLSLKGDLEGAERNFLVSLDWARRQQAKSWELRTSTSLARLWQGQGKRQDAYELLAPVYDWFTEGFDTKDLLDAKSLLAELG